MARPIVLCLARMSRNAVLNAVVLALVSWAPGCGDSVGPGKLGKAEVLVRDDPRAAAGATKASLLQAASFTGTAAGNFAASVSADGRTWSRLGSPNGITIQLQDTSGTTVHGASDASVGAYSHVRIVLSDVEVTVKAGSTFGAITLGADAKVTIAAQDSMVIEKTVTTFEVREDSTSTVVVDMNSEAWITAQALQGGAVDTASMRQSMTARVLAR